jgi:hyaluronan synthase
MRRSRRTVEATDMTADENMTTERYNARHAVEPADREAHTAEKKAGPLIGDVLVAMRAMAPDDALLSRYEQDLGDPRLFGEILVSQGRITQDQLDVALSVQAGKRSLSELDPSSALRSPLAHRVADRKVRRHRNVQSLAMFLVAVIGVGVITWASGGRGGWYGICAVSLLAVKVAASARYRPRRDAVMEHLTTAVVVPVFNEDPEAFRRCLQSIKAQTLLPTEIWVVDDGSADRSCVDVAEEVLADVAGVTIHRLDHNQGKRHAQGFAFSRTTCDIVVSLDSDTVLDPAAIAEGLRPFADETVMAVTGNVRALNRATNLLTRLIDLRYANAFLFERAAYSTVGSVVCCCGSLSFFRTYVVKHYLKDFLTQTFLGIQVQYGDDRRLTQYALMEGKVLVQDTAVAYTAVPERLGHFRRQQLRWNKSFFRESLWAMGRFGLARWPFWISAVELISWFAFSTSLIAAIYVRPIITGHMLPWYYVAYAVTLAYARNVRYFGRPQMSVRSQALTFAMAPLYALLHITLLTPLRLWALLTLRQRGWGTRASVEVALAPAQPVHSAPTAEPALVG